MSYKTKERDDIDFVITWVDGSDPNWLAEKKKYSPKQENDDRPQRYRDWGLLRYWFRGVEKFAPWVRTVHFVTWGHLPDWLDTEHPKLHIVRHADFMPAECLPTFNSNALEINLHRIKGLSEHFVYFNDDMMLLNHVLPEDFFIGGKPVDMLALQPVVANPNNPVMSRTYLNNSLLICKYFKKRVQMNKYRGKFFNLGYPPKYFIYNLLELAFPLYTGFYTVHGPSPLMKSTYQELWEREHELFEKVSMRKFRNGEDVNQYVFREWEKQRGNFVPVNLHRSFHYFDASDRSGRTERCIRKQKYKMACLNDSDHPLDFEAAKASLCAAFDEILPKASSFERQL